MSLFSFPNPVNEVAARTVAACVAVVALVAIVFQIPALIPVLAYGFLARVLTGPTLSPLGTLATKVVAPRIGDRPVAGPPKRFAQGMGAAMTVAATVLYFALGSHVAAYAVLGLVVVAATLESAFALCLGCKAFAVLMRAGVIPEQVCAECADISARLAGARESL